MWGAAFNIFQLVGRELKNDLRAMAYHVCIMKSRGSDIPYQQGIHSRPFQDMVQQAGCRAFPFVPVTPTTWPANLPQEKVGLGSDQMVHAYAEN